MEEFNVKHDGGLVYGKMAFPEGVGPCPLVIFSHGFGASHVYDSGMDRAFTSQGFAFAAFDFCGGGPESQSSGSMRDMSVLTEAADLNAVIDWARTLDAVDADRIFLLGTSQGGYVSTYVASGRPNDIAGLALFFPAFNIADDARRRLDAHGGEISDEMQIPPHVVGRRYVEDALATDIYARIGSYQGDVLIVHGALDEVVPIAYSRKAVDTFAGSCRLEVIDELGHGFRLYPPALHERALAFALDFFSAHLGNR